MAGRKLEGCWLELEHGQGERITVSSVGSDDKLVVGLASIDATADGTPVRLVLRHPDKGAVGNYQVKVQEPASLSVLRASGARDSVDPGLELEPVGEQRLVAATDTDSVVYDLRDGNLGNRAFQLNFVAEFEIANIDIVIPLINEIRLIPFFDRGGDTLVDTSINAKVGRIFGVRGVSLLLVIRLELRIQIRVVLVVRVDVNAAPFLEDGFENEFPSNSFPDFPSPLGTVTVGIRVEGGVSLLFALLVALVKKINPRGDTELIPLLTLGFVAGIDFRFTSQNRTLKLEGDFGVDVDVFINAIRPGEIFDRFDGRLLLASDRDQKVFEDGFGGFIAYYFAGLARRYCVPWEFDLELIRRPRSEGREFSEPLRFTTEVCLNIAPNPELREIIIESDPPATGEPETLELDLSGRATLKGFAVHVDEGGMPLPGRTREELTPTDQVEFFLQNESGILDPTTLPMGDGVAILEGDDFIRARSHQRQRNGDITERGRSISYSPLSCGESAAARRPTRVPLDVGGPSGQIPQASDRGRRVD